MSKVTSEERRIDNATRKAVDIIKSKLELVAQWDGWDGQYIELKFGDEIISTIELGS